MGIFLPEAKLNGLLNCWSFWDDKLHGKGMRMKYFWTWTSSTTSPYPSPQNPHTPHSNLKTKTKTDPENQDKNTPILAILGPISALRAYLGHFWQLCSNERQNTGKVWLGVCHGHVVLNALHHKENGILGTGKMRLTWGASCRHVNVLMGGVSETEAVLRGGYTGEMTFKK